MAAAIAVLVGYVGLIAAVLAQSKAALVARMTKTIFPLLAGDLRRACALLAVTLLATWWLLSGDTVVVDIRVKPVGDYGRAANEPPTFEVRLRRSGNDQPPASVTEMTPLRERVALVDVFDHIFVHASHPRYEPSNGSDRHTGRVIDLAGPGVTLSLRARPALEVEVLERGEPTPTPTVYEVTGRAANQDVSVRKDLSDRGRATFLGRWNWHWQVVVQRKEDGRVVHRSPGIRFDGMQLYYAAELYPAPAPDDEPSLHVDWSIIPGGELVTVDFPPDASTVENPAWIPEPPPAAVEAQVRFLGERSRRNGSLVSLLPLDSPSTGDILIRDGYVANYNHTLKIPNWVSYGIRPSSHRRTEDRPAFSVDIDLDGAFAPQREDYQGSGYDRGHLVSPLDITAFGTAAIRETYLLSAVAPQTPRLNRVTWLAIEQMARAYADARFETIYVAAGTVFVENGSPDARETPETMLRIGTGVAVPSHYFRVHARLVDGRPEVLAFLVPNVMQISPDPGDYIVSLGRIEDATRLRFFPRLEPARQPARDYVPTTLWTAQLPTP